MPHTPPRTRPERGIVHLEHGGLVVTVDPIGARIAQITDSTGHPWLVETGRRVPGTATADIAFEAGARGGWDECLPSISPTADPNRVDSGDRIADHGDFWFRPWHVVSSRAREVVLECRPDGHPLAARRTVRLTEEPDTVEVVVEIENRTRSSYQLLYSAHPLWRWPDDAELEIDGPGEIRASIGSRWAVNDSGRWPYLGAVDLSQLAREGPAQNEKFFVRWGGAMALRFGGQPGATMTMRQPDPAPWLGVCTNRDTWPAGDPGDSWIAVEPTTSPTDSLTDACTQGTAYRLDPMRASRWRTEVTFGHEQASDDA